MTGIQQMFSDLMGHDAYDLQLEMWCWRQRAARAEYFKDWRQANREHVRAYDAARVGRVRPLKRDTTQCRDCKQPAVPGRRSCESHLAKARERAARSGGAASI